MADALNLPPVYLIVVNRKLDREDPY